MLRLCNGHDRQAENTVSPVKRFQPPRPREEPAMSVAEVTMSRNKGIWLTAMLRPAGELAGRAIERFVDDLMSLAATGQHRGGEPGRRHHSGPGPARGRAAPARSDAVRPGQGAPARGGGRQPAAGNWSSSAETSPPYRPPEPGMPNGTALTRTPSRRLAEGLVTHLARVPVDLELAKHQHSSYQAALEAAGWLIHPVDPIDDCPDSVFVEDTVVVSGDLAVLTRARSGGPARGGGRGRGRCGRGVDGRPHRAARHPRRRRRAPDRLTVYIGHGGRTNATASNRCAACSHRSAERSYRPGIECCTSSRP